jgi:large conductance mechanosensitive channel
MVVKGFVEFIRRGNLVQVAVAFVMGLAFAAVVNSFVTNLISPLLGLVGGVNFADQGVCLTAVCKPSVDPATGATTYSGVFLGWGAFVTTVITFLVTALVLYFFVLKPYERLESRWKKDEEEAASAEVELLTEIRDALRARS